MKLSAINLRQSVQELFFMIAPPPHIMSDVSVLKDDVQYLIGKKFDDRFSKGHFSLFKYDDDHHLDDMIDFVESKAIDFKPFNVFLKDFSVIYTGSKRTIYMDIINKYPIQEIFEKTVREDINFTPHLTIAKNLSDADFLKCWPYLKSLHYSQHFTCDRITVLARLENRWVPYRNIKFGVNP
jgi:2'-5' RNA ligase